MNARFKTIILAALSSVLAFSAVTYNSCKPDKCKSIRCAYGGVCKDGNCLCQSGYEGSQCETVIRDKFLGVWSVFESSTMTGQPRNYTVNITEGDNITDVKIRNFYNLLTNDVYAIVKGDSLVINKQSIDGRTIQGYGYLDPDMHYTEHAKLIVHYAVVIDSSSAIDDYGLYPSVGGTESLWEK